MRILGLFFGFVLVLVTPATGFGQLTVDATGPIRQRKWDATRGRGGGVGRKLPLEVSIGSEIPAPDVNGERLVEFVLKNSGSRDLELPISPHPADFEPADANVAYTVSTLALRISLSKSPGAFFHGGADLYGNASIPATLVNLAPGESIRVLTRVALGRSGSEPIVATASLRNESLRKVGREVLLDSQEIGFASSKTYSLNSLPTGRNSISQ